MRTHRFGRKLKLPSTVAIRHEILKLMMQDELETQALAAKANKALVAHSNGTATAPTANLRHADGTVGLALSIDAL